ncbi:hypothetical protein Tco_1170336, partial [Tanacetum coccineum]
MIPFRCQSDFAGCYTSSVEVTATPSVLPTSPVETTVAPYFMHASPVRNTPAPVTSTTPTPRITGGCNRVTAGKRIRYRPTIPTLVPSMYSSLGSSHSSSSSETSSERPLPHRRQQCSDYVTPSLCASAGPSRNRCRSSVTSVPATAHLSGALSLVRADLLPPRKRFRGSSASSPQ